MLDWGQLRTRQLLAQVTLVTVMVTVTAGCQGHGLHLCTSLATPGPPWWCRKDASAGECPQGTPRHAQLWDGTPHGPLSSLLHILSLGQQGQPSCGAFELYKVQGLPC